MRQDNFPQDVARLRALAEQMRECAADPANERHKRLWTAVNDRHMIVPTVIARDYPAYLIDYKDELRLLCEDPLLRGAEWQLLTALYEWRHMRGHRVVEDVIYCPVVYSDRRYGIQQSHHYKPPYTDSVHFERQIDNEDDIQKILDAEITCNESETLRKLSRLQEVFDGLLRVKLQGVDHFDFRPWDDLMMWMGIEEGMYDLAVRPEFMHKAVQRYVDVSVQRARRCEALGILSSNNRNSLIAAAGYGYTDHLPPPTESGIGAKLADVWGDGRDQIFTSVSPAMTKEFAFEPAKPWYDLFGLNCYGCCEDLGRKVAESQTMPRLRKLSVSPFADLETAMEAMGGEVVVSFKPDPSHLAVTPWRKDRMRTELETACRLARKYGCHMEILMKTLITLDNDPSRLWEWCDLATNIAEGC